jgi:hypothetical protein
LFADVEETAKDEVAAEALPDACAPEALVWAEVCVRAAAPVCVEAVEAVVCAEAAQAPSIPMASTEGIRFMIMNLLLVKQWVCAHRNFPVLCR